MKETVILRKQHCFLSAGTFYPLAPPNVMRIGTYTRHDTENAGNNKQEQREGMRFATMRERMKIIPKERAL